MDKSREKKVDKYARKIYEAQRMCIVGREWSEWMETWENSELVVVVDMTFVVSGYCERVIAAFEALFKLCTVLGLCPSFEVTLSKKCIAAGDTLLHYNLLGVVPLVNVLLLPFLGGIAS